MAANPIYNSPAQDIRAKTAEKIRLRWPEIMEGLIDAAIRGNVQAFLMLREEAWGTPTSGVKQNPTAISLEELISADESVNLPQILEGLIQAAIRGNVQAFLVLREIAWGTPISGVNQNPTAISFEEIISADEGVTPSRGQRSTRGTGGQ